MEVKRKYGLLRAIGWLVQAIGVILFIAVIIGAIGLLASGDTVLSIVGGISLPLGIIASVQIFVVGSLLTLATDLEYNTRSNTEAIKVLARKIEAMETAPAAPPAVVVAPVAAPEAEAVEVEPPPPPPPPPPADEPAPEEAEPAEAEPEPESEDSSDAGADDDAEGEPAQAEEPEAADEGTEPAAGDDATEEKPPSE